MSACVNRDVPPWWLLVFAAICALALIGHASAANTTIDTTTVPGQTIITYTCDIHKTNLTAYWVAPAGVTSVWYTMVGGGGGGGGSPSGGSGAGGGGGGGFINGTIAVTATTNYTIFVGRGGAGGTVVYSDSDYGNNGINSTFNGLIAVGGGGGGVINNPGKSGGTGGGSGNGAEDQAQPLSLSPVQGHQGGLGYLAPYYPGGGGGGSGADGQDAPVGKGGDGGAGATSTITGSSVGYGGGGGGGSDDGSWGGAGSGGGGHGTLAFLEGDPGTDGLGGGGGGDDSVGAFGGQDGGNGVIIIRYTTPANLTTVTDGDYTINTYIAPSQTTSAPSSWTAPTGVINVEYLVVGGGGSGGSFAGGGGGAGGFKNGTITVTPGNSYSITVGAGGTAVSTYALGNDGGQSVFSTITAAGGGKGGGGGFAGGNGASGGGGAASMTSPYTYTNGGSATDLGHAGGKGITGADGGGGAGGNRTAGGDATSGTGGNGGDGSSSDITGTTTYYSAGGGGSGNVIGGTGGTGGGGTGSVSGESGVDATANTGSGGGGLYITGGGLYSGTGAAGIVVIKYRVEPAASLPIVSFTKNQTSGLQNLPVEFIDGSFIDILTWDWDFDNGNHSSLQNPIYTFYTLGDHHVTLTVTNASGSAISDAQTVTVLQRYAPIVNFTSNVTTGESPLDIEFTDISVLDPISWIWTFGTPAGNTSTLQNPSFHFTEYGTVPVTLQVTNASGTASKTLYYIITAPPEPPLCMFTPANNRSVLWPAGIKLTSTSTNNPINMSWEWGDGVTTYGNVTAKHIYAIPGQYHIIATATNTAGHSHNDTYVKVVI